MNNNNDKEKSMLSTLLLKASTEKFFNKKIYIHFANANAPFPFRYSRLWNKISGTIEDNIFLFFLSINHSSRWLNALGWWIWRNTVGKNTKALKNQPQSRKHFSFLSHAIQLPLFSYYDDNTIIHNDRASNRDSKESCNISPLNTG